MTRLDAAGSTDPGRVRSQNQDTFAIADALVLIADGMGGYAGGEVAASIAAEVVEERFADDATSRGLATAVRDANRRIHERGVEPGLEGMGTTLVALALLDSPAGPRLLLANVGDSRCYLLRTGALRQLTEDHSVAAELVRLGRIDEDEGAEHPGRHVLTRALGVEVDVEPDLIELEAVLGDRLLLCSDGLSNELADAAILSLLAVGSPSDASRALVAGANAHGGLDNITAVVVDVLDAPTAPPGTARSSSTGAVAATGAVLAGAATTIAPPRPGTDPAPLTLRPMLSRRERLRRRREDRSARRRWNKWVSLRGAVFVVLLAAVIIGGFVVLRWYGTSNYIVVKHGQHMVIIQGRPGGFLWWQPKVAVTENYGIAQLKIDPPTRAALVGGISLATRADAVRYLANFHDDWLRATGRLPATTTTTTTTLAPMGGT